MRDQTILITGGAGTFGSQFTRYALDRGAARVIVLSRNEHRQAALRAAIKDDRLECWIGDVRNPERLRWAFQCSPDVVIHAAALKRVEVCESDPDEALETNIDGTRHVVKAAMQAGIPKVLVISSDKACSPETLYGVTKAAAESAALSQNRYRGTGPTAISVVRYGNVLGSQGSFLEVLQRCALTGETVPVTDPTATRFWWTIQDAVAFVGTVLDRMRGCEIWVPKLTSASVADLIRQVAPVCPVTVIGMRGPEKRHEAMINATEAPYTYDLPDCYVILPKAEVWWGSKPLPGWTRVPDGFTFTSDRALHTEALEALCASAS